MTLAVAGMGSGVLAPSGVASGQTSGTWNVNNGNWNTASNWVNSVVPGDGGVATFGERSSPPTVTVNTPTILTGITFNSALRYSVVGTAAGTGSLVIPASGTFTLNAERSARDSLTYFLREQGVSSNFNRIGATITSAATGSVLVKTGPGGVTLDGTNSYGSVSINQGTLSIGSGDLALGDAGGPISFGNGAALRVILSSLTAARPITLNGQATIETPFSQITATFNGSITGAGSLLKRGLGVLAIQQPATGITGNITVRDEGRLFVQGAGSISSAPTVDYAGVVQLSSAGGASSNRLGANTALISRGGEFVTTTAGVGTSISESVGGLSLDYGYNTITGFADSGTTNTVNFASVTRLNRGTLFVRATNLGDTTNAAIVSFTNTAGLPLVGGTGLAGSVDQPIVPFVAGSRVNNFLAADVATLVTRDGNRLRALLPEEHAGAIIGSSPTSNVRLDFSTVDTDAAGNTVNSLSLIFRSTVSATGGLLTVTSGAILTTDGGGLIGVPLAFGAAEGLIHGYSNLTTTGAISGTNGVTKTGNGLWRITGNGTSSTYSGTTTIMGGVVAFEGNLPSGANSALGNSASPVVLAASLGASANPSDISQTGLYPLATGVISRPLSVRGQETGLVLLGSSASTGSLTVNGTIDLQRDLVIGGRAGTTTTFTGVISGPGRLTDDQTSAATVTNLRLNASNAFSGGVEIAQGNWIVANNAALGSGLAIIQPISSARPPSLIAAGGARVITNDLLFVRFNVTTPQFLLGNSDGASSLTLSGTVDFNGTLWNVGVVGTNPATLSGPLINGALIKTGIGTLILTSDSSSLLQASSITAGVLQIGNGGSTGSLGATLSMSVAASGSLVFNRNNPVTFATPIIGAGTVSQVGTSSLALSSTVSAGEIAVTGTGATISLTAPASPSTFTIAGSASRITVGAGNTLAVSSTARPTNRPKVLVASTLAINATGFLDLTNNDLIVPGGVASVGTLRGLVATWLATPTRGLGSSAATAFTTLAVFPNVAEAGLAYFSSYDGIALTASDVIVKYTYKGDTNLDGLLDGVDLVNIIEGLSNGYTGWQNGDIDYDGDVDAADLAAFNTAFANQSGSFGNGAGSAASVAGVVPEPTSPALLLSATPLLGRRRRSR